LTNATLPYVAALADKGWKEATATVPGLAEGLSTHDGQLLSAEVAAAHSYTAVS
ncbi:alanine dehydrogenase, partial [Rhodococcus sp. IEGM 1351]|nr:alanine dehydrogenase [Rhodococcus sp. IEGM 1351]